MSDDRATSCYQFETNFLPELNRCHSVFHSSSVEALTEQAINSETELFCSKLHLSVHKIGSDKHRNFFIPFDMLP